MPIKIVGRTIEHTSELILMNAMQTSFDINTQQGVIDELTVVNRAFRIRLNNLHLKEPNLTITEWRKKESELFEEWRNTIFDIVHSSTALEID